MLHEVDEAQSHINREAVQPEGPGIMVLSSLLQVLHVNRRGATLLNDLVSAIPETLAPINAPGALPPLLVDLAGKILGMLRQRDESGEKGHSELCYLADNPRKQVVVRCVGLPRGNRIEDARIVFVMTEAKSEAKSTPIPTRASAQS